LTEKSKYIIIYPIALIVFLLIAVAVNSKNFTETTTSTKSDAFKEIYGLKGVSHSSSKFNILNENDVSVGLKDTVYTDLDSWLELRIDQQMLYQHNRDGRIVKYPVSSGNKALDRSTESRPGLFAIFHKEERHESTQYNNAEMFYFMPFNQGIGFHSLNGTGYYGNLGVRPSSHGCIRMRHEDVKKLFKDSPIGTLVLAHSGFSARVVDFAPEGYEQKEQIEKDEMKYLIAENLYNILEGNYYVAERRFFVIDPKIIPVSGIYNGYNKKLPTKQKIIKGTYYFASVSDRCDNIRKLEILDSVKSADYLIDFNVDDEIIADSEKNNVDRDLSAKEVIKLYFHNPIGILPYYGPQK